MANPMNTLRWEDAAGYYKTFVIDADTITFDKAKVGGSVAVGKAVTLNSTAGEVELVGDGGFVLGKLIDVAADGYCTVQVGGAMTLPGGASATLTPGTKIVGDLGASDAKGFIQSAPAPAATYGEAVADAQALARGAIVNAATATAVWVLL